jgi:thiol:disulfide interchange protein DsbC
LNAVNNFILAAMMSASACAALAAPSAEDVAKSLKLAYPNTKFKKVSATPLPGIYEVVMGRNVAFVEPSGRYFLFGRLFDMEKQQDLTTEIEQESRKLDFSRLPLDKAIKTVRGNGERVVAVFSDPDCPYCKRLEAELSKLDNVTVYTFLYPLESIHPDSGAHARAIWCQKDRSLAWSDLMLHNKPPKAADAKCVAPIDSIKSIARDFGIEGTPFLVASDGRTFPGAAAADRLDEFLGVRQ